MRTGCDIWRPTESRAALVRKDARGLFGLYNPVRWLPKVWGGHAPKFRDLDELNRFTALVMAYHNDIAVQFEIDSAHFARVGGTEGRWGGGDARQVVGESRARGARYLRILAAVSTFAVHWQTAGCFDALMAADDWGCLRSENHRWPRLLHL